MGEVSAKVEGLRTSQGVSQTPKPRVLSNGDGGVPSSSPAVSQTSVWPLDSDSSQPPSAEHVPHTVECWASTRKRSLGLTLEILGVWGKVRKGRHQGSKKQAELSQDTRGALLQKEKRADSTFSKHP